MNLADLIAVARGDKPADLILKNARIVNTFIGAIEEGNVAIAGEYVAGIGNYTSASQVIDLKGAYLSPGLINGHTHLESSMLHPVQYARAVIPRGTSSLVTDLHEIANVAGMKGMHFIMDWAERLPLDMFFMAPSCVPATYMETSGATIDENDIKAALKLPDVIGLGEMMNFPGVINGFPEVLNKISAAHGKVIDGHAPGVSDLQLNAYLAAGIRSDHESTKVEEGMEKLRKGMYLMIREGSSEKNLETLLPLVNEKTCRRCIFVVDDRSCSDLLAEGDIDGVVRKAISKGLDPIMAIQMVTINPSEHFRLHDRGAIAPGYIANLITFSSLSDFDINMVFYKGNLVAEGGHAVFTAPPVSAAELTDTVRVKPFARESLDLRTTKSEFPVIEIVPHQIVTQKSIEKVALHNGIVTPDIARNIAKIVVVERHKATGNIGIGLVKGFGLKTGALASSVAHDSHNIIATGIDDLDIYIAIKEIERLNGGLVVCNKGVILASLPLPVCGLLSHDPLEIVVSQLNKVETAAATLGNLPPAPFALLSFLALPVIPELKLTDLGIVDVLAFKLIS